MHIMRMINPRKNYAWGSRVALQQLLGEQPDGTTLAEIWMGAHPSAPSGLENGTTLAELPDGERQNITFILKLLSAEKGLSIQAHPSKEQAERGFASESGVPVDAPHRVFRDRNHKPELIVALEPFWAMSGFRPLPEARDALVDVGIPEAAEVSSLQELLDVVLALDAARTDAILGKPGFRDAPAPPETLTGPITEEVRSSWVAELYRQFGGDSGVLAPVFLNLVYLSPGTGLYQPSGVLHAYLRGTGVEVMAESDNVLRAGLTEKHVDVNGLRNVVSFVTEPPAVSDPVPAHSRTEPLRAGAAGRGALEVYDAPADEFRLYRLRVGGESVAVRSAGLPAIAVCVSGSVTVRELEGGAEGDRRGQATTGDRTGEGGDRRGQATTGAEGDRPDAGGGDKPDAGGGSPGCELGPGTSAYIPSYSGGFVVSGRGEVFIATRAGAASGPAINGTDQEKEDDKKDEGEGRARR